MFKRIFTGYLAVLLISFTVFSVAFSLTVRHYLITDTVNSLHRVAETLSAAPLPAGMHGSGHMRGAFFNLANRIAYADYVVISKDNLILESSDQESYPPGTPNTNQVFTRLTQSREADNSLIQQDLIAVTLPIITGDGETAAALILYSQMDVLAQLNQSLLGIFTISLAAGVLVSLLAGAFATRLVIGPLQLLKTKATELAGRQFKDRLEINTGDELEELAEAFNDMAEQLAEYDLSQKDFFQRASHELKTPLMSVQGYAEAIKDGVIQDDAEINQGLEVIIKESMRMKALVEEFIFLSKVERPQENYLFQALNLENALNEAVYSMQSLALEKKIELEAKYKDQEEIIINGDAEQIHRLFLNLLSNGLRSAAERVTVTLRRGTITIEDDGSGFIPCELEKVFNPFYTGHQEGSGLGLAISRAIILKHGGAISAANKPAGGALITITFPALLKQPQRHG